MNTASRMQEILISIVAPIFNEQETLPELYRQVIAVMENTGLPFEFLLVNDGSTDGSLEEMIELAQADDRIKVLEFSRNFGHQAAILAGLDYAQGDAVITLDGDLQHPPELIPDLIAKWQEGYDIVYTYREGTENSGPLKDWTSRFFYKLLNRLGEVNVASGAADFRLLDRRVVDVLHSFEERALFLRGLVSWVGYRQIALPYTTHPRYAGESKYSFGKMMRFAIDGITSFSSLPLYISMFVGLIISAASFLYGLYAIITRLFTTHAVEGWASVLVAVLFLGGILLVTLGIQGVYMGRIYHEVKGRPHYLVRHTYGFQNETRKQEQPMRTPTSHRAQPSSRQGE